MTTLEQQLKLVAGTYPQARGINELVEKILKNDAFASFAPEAVSDQVARLARAGTSLSDASTFILSEIKSAERAATAATAGMMKDLFGNRVAEIGADVNPTATVITEKPITPKPIAYTTSASGSPAGSGGINVAAHNQYIAETQEQVFKQANRERAIGGWISLLVGGFSLIGAVDNVTHIAARDEAGRLHIQWSQMGWLAMNAGIAGLSAWFAHESFKPVQGRV